MDIDNPITIPEFIRRFGCATHTPAAPAERLCDDCNIIELEDRVMHLEQDLKDARKAERKQARMELLKDLQTFIDNADSRIGCPNGTLGVAYLVQWMRGRGYDCD